MKRLIPSSLALAALIAVGNLPIAARAYVPPSEFLVKNLAAKHKTPKPIQIRSIVTSLEGDPASRPRVRVTTIYHPSSRILRSWAYDDTDREIFRYEKRAGNLPVGAALLFDANATHLAASLREAGIPVRTEAELLALKDEEERRAAEVSALGRWNKAFAWVIGAKTMAQAEGVSDDPMPQLWLEKDGFLPQRAVFRPKDDSSFVDVRFENYRFHQDFPYPRTLSVFRRGNAPLLRDEILDFAIVTDVSAFRKPFPPGLTEAGESAASPIRDLLRQYYSIIR